jgi:hypothetical protein
MSDILIQSYDKLGASFTFKLSEDVNNIDKIQFINNYNKKYKHLTSLCYHFILLSLIIGITIILELTIKISTYNIIGCLLYIFISDIVNMAKIFRLNLYILNNNKITFHLLKTKDILSNYYSINVYYETYNQNDGYNSLLHNEDEQINV